MQVNDWLNKTVAEMEVAVADHQADGEGMSVLYQADQMVEAAACREAVDAVKVLAGKLATVDAVDGCRFTVEHELCDLLLNASVGSHGLEAEIRARAAKIESRVYRALFTALDLGTITVGEVA
jgi:hypothetical protein